MESSLNDTVKNFGREVFKAIGEEQPSAFSVTSLSGKVMEWSMTKPDFKNNMFRLVDVLPTLQDSTAVARHVNEYLAEPARDLNALLGWGVNVDPRSLRAKVTSFTVKRAVHEMAKMFIAGEAPQQALKHLRRIRKDSLAFTVDLLGEYSVSEKEALAYVKRYLDAIEVLGREVPQWGHSDPIVADHPADSVPVNVSVKLSALYSQCSSLNFERSVEILSERLRQITAQAVRCKASLYVDAEDSARNPMIYAAFKQVFGSGEFQRFPLPGIVVQAYAKDSEDCLLDLLKFAKERGSPIAVRLVKGAYWDHETVLAAQNHWESPLWAEKSTTDAHYEHLSRILIDHSEVCLPAFGSHNIRSLAFACCYAERQGLGAKDFELQMLYGMAEPIARAFGRKGYLVRLYVPIGRMLPGMGYLVRRLLENTSNESFLRHTFYDSENVEKLLDEPLRAT